MTVAGSVTVTPTTFTKVNYDADIIAGVVTDVAEKIPGLPEGVDLQINVNEEEPTIRVAISSLDPLVLEVESGAFEETKSPRTFGRHQAALVIARLLIEAVDRMNPDFGAPPVGEPTDFAAKVAWEVSAIGRASRLGFAAYKPRYLYNFRNRFGFSDEADALFERIWSNDRPVWADLG